MGKIDRIYELLGILHQRHTAVSLADLADQLECSVPTVKRYLATLRNEYGAPLRYDFKYNGYILDWSLEFQPSSAAELTARPGWQKNLKKSLT